MRQNLFLHASWEIQHNYITMTIISNVIVNITLASLAMEHAQMFSGKGEEINNFA